MSFRQPAPFEIRRSGIAGTGAFATEHIPKGTRLIEYMGERVSHKVADSRYDDPHEDGSSHVVLFAVDDKIVIDPGVGGNDARFFNHSCAPNCQSVIEKKRVWLDTIRDVEAGEELTYDYEIPRTGETDEEARKYWPCRCGAPKCRGTLLLPLPARKPRRKTAKKSKARKTRSTAAKRRRRART
jgi:SET domain-containing protein